MVVLDVGRICIKKMGREACGKCVIVDIVDKSFVVVTGPKILSGIKRRRVNIRHIEPMNCKLQIARRASDEDVLVALETEGKTEEMRVGI